MPIGWGAEVHERELQATTASVKGLKAAGYEPSAILHLLSKLAYEHAAWAKAILSEDLLHLRATLEGDIPPSEGYLIDSSEFMQQRAKFVAAIDHAAKRTRPPSLVSSRSH
jgi:hypothetical protein